MNRTWLSSVVLCLAALFSGVALSERIPSREIYWVVCNEAANLANTGAMRFGYGIDGVVSDKGKRSVLKSLGLRKDEIEFHEINSLVFRADINSDGHVETVLSGDAGTGHYYYVSVFSSPKGNKGRTKLQRQDEANEPFDAMPVKILGGYYFVLTANNWSNELNSLWRFDKEGKFREVCSFAKKQQPSVKLNLSKEPEVCSAIASGTIDEISFAPIPQTEKQTLSELNVFERKAAVADINNDGVPERLLRANIVMKLGGRECDHVALFLGDDIERKKPLGNILLQLGGLPCSNDVNVFAYRNNVYVDTQRADGSRAIEKINRDAIESVCYFEGRVINFVKKCCHVAD
jgi:hypothetical protein